MKKRLQSKLNMYLVVKDQVVADKDEMALLPGFTAATTELLSTFDEIVVANAQANLKGASGVVEKESARTALVEIVTVVSSKLLAFARFNKNADLEKDVAYSPSVYRRMSAQNLLVSADTLLLLANNNEEALEDFLLKAEDLTALNEAIVAFRSVTTLPTTRRNAKRVTKQDLEALFVKADDILAKIDVVIEVIRYTKPALYDRYKMARRVMSLPSVTMSVKGQVVDMANSMPIVAAEIKFVELESVGGEVTDEEPVLTKSTADKGGFLVKSLPEGIYRVTVSKVGYKEKTVDIVVNNSQTNGLTLMLEVA